MLQHPILPEPTNLDDWVCHIINIHFHPEYGSSFWLEKAKDIRIDPRRDIRRYDDLAMLGFFPIDELRRRDIREFLPAKIAQDPAKLRVYETGGTTGTPCRIANREYLQLMNRWLDWYYDHIVEFPRDANWLWIGPTGPHAIGDLIQNFANTRGGMCYRIDLDPRFIKLLYQKNDRKTLDLYLDHIRSQSYAILDTQDIHVLGTTPALIEILGPEMSDQGYEFRGLLYGGTHLNPDLYQLLCTEFFPHAVNTAIYGNTLMGMAPMRPYQSDDRNIVYCPLEPFFKIEIVDLENPNKILNYHETGQVCFSLMTEDLFFPRVLERDQAERWEALPQFGWDSVANVRPHTKNRVPVTEGVY